MAAWIILIGFGIAVAGVLVKVGVDVARDLREDREAHGGRQTAAVARRAALIGILVALLVLFVVVWPLVFGD